MFAKAQHTTASSLRRTSLWFVCIAAICALFADLDIIGSDPWLELGRIGLGLVTPDFFAIESLWQTLFNTLAFALLGVVIANVFGFGLAIIFNWRIIRLFCSAIRAVHELFWALILLQLFGLHPLTGILAIAIPYAGIFAKVYAEILEESDQRAHQALAPQSGVISAFFYTRFAIALPHLKSYCLYRLECGIRSSAILGFIGLPTLGFYLDTAFKQGHYSEASALLYLFFLLIATLRYWMRLKLVPIYLLSALWLLPTGNPINWQLLQRFFTEDIIPSPLRGSDAPFIQQLDAFQSWCWTLIETQALEGIYNTVILSLMALVATAVVALVLFPLIASHFCSRPVRSVGQLALIVFRSIPELILAFICTLLLGPSMLPAIIALALHNGAIIGFLIGQYSDCLTLRDDACQGWNRYFYELLPRIYPQFLAFLFYRWEVITRETAILGILGIHTLGFYIDSAFEDLRFDRAMFLILITACLNMLLDSISRRLRSQIHTANFERMANC